VDGLTGTLQGFLGFRSVACSQTAYGLVLLLGFLAGVRYFGELGVIWAFAAAAAVGAFTAAILIPGRLAGLEPPSVVGGTHVISESYGFQCPFHAIGADRGPVVWLTNAILARSRYGYESVGSLNIASTARLLALFVPLLIFQAVLPYALTARARGDRASFDRVLRGLHNGVAVPLNIAALLLAAIVPLLSGLLGKPYRGVSEATALLLVSVAIQGYGAPGSVALQCSNRLWWGFALNLAWAAAVLFMAFKFVGTLDSSAVALGYSAGYVLLVISQSFLLREFLPAPLFKRSILGALLNLIPTGALAFASTGSAWQWPVLLLSSVASLLLWCPSERQRGQEGSGHMPRFSETESLDPETR